jgi:hypothetical protein
MKNMKKHLIWIIAGTAAIGLAVPAFAAVQPNATPDDNGTPGEIRGNCDEAEHAADPECLTVTVSAPSAAAPTTIQVTVPSTSAPSNTTPGTVPSNTTGNTVPDNSTAGSVPANTVPDNSTVGTVPSNTVNSVPGDISGPCDEAEHANDPRCTGAAPSDDGSGRHSGDDDGSGHDSGDDDSGHHGGGDDDNSGHGGSDDD